jgi:hypothetical protein
MEMVATLLVATETILLDQVRATVQQVTETEPVEIHLLVAMVILHLQMVIMETILLDQVRVMVQQVETLLHLMVAMEEIMVIMEAIHHLHIQMEEMVVDQILLLQEDLDSDSLNVEPDYLILEWIN